MSGARVRARVRASCRASASVRSSTASRARSSSAASCSTTSAGSCSRWTGGRMRSRASSRGWRVSRRRSPWWSESTATGWRRPGSATSASSRASRCGEADALVAHEPRPATTASPRCVDPADRRYRYPFINCTNCGPRFTIVRGVPYDRPATTMAGFAMCAACQAEYDDPVDRRFHAQPNACPAAGRRAAARRRGSADRRGAADAVRAATRWLADGAVLAVKGIGGYHLACDAANDVAVAELRRRKRREDRPFALMARDELADARAGRARRGRADAARLAARGRSCWRRRSRARRSPLRSRPACRSSA